MKLESKVALVTGSSRGIGEAIATLINQDLLNNPEELKKVTQNIPLGRLGKPEEVAALAAF